MLIAKSNIKYEGKTIAKGSEIKEGQIKDKVLKELIADGAVEKITKADITARLKKNKEEAEKKDKEAKEKAEQKAIAGLREGLDTLGVSYKDTDGIKELEAKLKKAK